MVRVFLLYLLGVYFFAIEARRCPQVGRPSFRTLRGLRLPTGGKHAWPAFTLLSTLLVWGLCISQQGLGSSLRLVSFSLVAHVSSTLVITYIHMPFRSRPCIIFLLIASIPTILQTTILQTIISSCKLSCFLANCTITFYKLSFCKLLYLNLANCHLVNCYIFLALGHGVWSYCSGNFNGLKERYLNPGPPRQALS